MWQKEKLLELWQKEKLLELTKSKCFQKSSAADASTGGKGGLIELTQLTIRSIYFQFECVLHVALNTHVIIIYFIQIYSIYIYISNDWTF